MTNKIILQPHQITKLLQRFTHKEIGDIFEVNEKTIPKIKKIL
ncbi:MAG: hypothetical protein NY202_00620 [Mollicutes bacterium UO1]